MSSLAAFASMFGGGGGGGLPQIGGAATGGSAGNRSVNFNGPSGGAVDGLGALLAYANGGPPANGGSFGPDMGYFSQGRATGGAMPYVMIGGAILLALLVLRR